MEFQTQLKEKTLVDRQEQATRIMKKFFPKLPVIIDRANRRDPIIDKNKYIIDPDTSISSVISIIRKRITIEPHQSLFIFMDNQIPNANHTIREIYYSKALEPNHDGFLYLTYSIENTFG